MSAHTHVTSVYVDRLSRQWIVRDAEGQFWIVPTGENSWERRELVTSLDLLALEPLPGHYIDLLALPF